MERKEKGRILCDKLKQIPIGFLGLARCMGTSSGTVLCFFPEGPQAAVAPLWILGWDTTDLVLPSLVLNAFSRIGKEGCFGDILMLGKYF